MLIVNRSTHLIKLCRRCRAESLTWRTHFQLLKKLNGNKDDQQATELQINVDWTKDEEAEELRDAIYAAERNPKFVEVKTLKKYLQEALQMLMAPKTNDEPPPLRNYQVLMTLLEERMSLLGVNRFCKYFSRMFKLNWQKTATVA